MAVHFIHVGKAGGTALRYALREARDAADGSLRTPWGPIRAHKHKFVLADVPQGDKAFFALRDPVDRFVSGFYSRQRKGAPRYNQEWSDRERKSFEWFATPEELADALAETNGESRRRAEFALNSIRQLRRPITKWTGGPDSFRRNLDKVLYIARQETLDDDWERLKELLDLPRHVLLPRDPVAAHRNSYPNRPEISERGRQALARWYADDYEIIRIADEVRQGRRPPPGFMHRVKAAVRKAPIA